MGRVNQVNNLQNSFFQEETMKEIHVGDVQFLVCARPTPQFSFLRFRPVIAEHPILCEDIDMGRDAELRRVRWAGSLSSIICKTNVFTKEK